MTEETGVMKCLDSLLFLNIFDIRNNSRYIKHCQKDRSLDKLGKLNTVLLLEIMDIY